jgi:transcriptional regulator with XRE-family HTH domain
VEGAAEKQGKDAPPPGAPLCASTKYYTHGKIDTAKNGKSAPETELALPKMELALPKMEKEREMGIFEDNNRKYADAFTRMREKRGISLQDVSNRSGIAASTLTRTLQGTTGTPMATYEILVTQGLGATVHEFVDEIYGAVPQAEEPTQRYTNAVRLLLAEKDGRIRQLSRWLRRTVIYSVSVTGILMGLFLYDVLNPAVGWLRRHA